MTPVSTYDENLLGERIRNRREARDLAAYALAEQVEISPSYLSLIESGAKVPSEEIAARLAEALDDDPELYRAWVQASRHPDLRRHVDRLMRIESFRSSPEMLGRLRRGDQVALDPEADGRAPGEMGSTRLASASRRMLSMQRRAEGSRLLRPLQEERTPYAAEAPEAAIEVPVLPDGTDPGEDPWLAEDVVETVWLDRRLLPPDAVLPFAYRPGAAMVERVRRAVRPGDLVVLTGFGGTIDPASIYAVRHEGAVVLSRVVPHGTILLLPADESGRPASVECRNEYEVRDHLAGVVVATLRSWPQPTPWGTASTDVSTPVAAPYRSRPSGRSVRVEGDFLVRDTEWRDRYGWRPVQRPEDLEWLERHPGTRMRYRLIRDGRVRFLLELGPDDWRRALGRYGRSPSWPRNGYVVAITQRRGGDYTEEFQDRWAPYVRRPREGEDEV